MGLSYDFWSVTIFEAIPNGTKSEEWALVEENLTKVPMHWPTLNGALLVACPGAVVPTILEELHALDKSQPLQGLRAFVWNVEASI